MSTVEEQIANAERSIDDAWRRMPVPAAHLGAAKWVVLSVCEDLMRMPLIHDKLAEAFAGDLRYMHWIDDLKYALKHALSRLDGECEPGVLRRAPTNMNGDHYRAATKLLRTGMTFRLATIAFGAFHAGAERCELRDGVLSFVPAGDFDLRYRARELLENSIAPKAPRAGSAILRVREWLTDPPASVRNAIEMITVRTRKVHSPAESEALATIFAELPNTAYVLPTAWKSPFGDAATVSQILQGLVSVCAWSFLRVTMGEVFHGQTGVGLEWIAPVTTTSALAAQVAAIAGTPLDPTKRLLELLTYGGSVQSPDPALQPLVPVASGVICFAPLFVCGCALERNMLALLARADPKAFDAASDAFEDHMTDLLRDVLKGRPWSVVCNSHMPGASAAGEVDVIVIDPASHHVLVLELWWMIPPGETREVLQREATARTKTRQAARKRDAAQSNLPALLKRSKINLDATGWTVTCALVSESFLPISRVEVPVLTRRTLQCALKRSDDLSKVAGWIASDEWLPKLGEHYTEEADITEIGGVRFSIRGVAVPEAGLVFARSTLGD